MGVLARPLICANLAGIWFYIVVWQGAERFFFESFGTLIISPVIYTRICPEAFRPSLVRVLAREPYLQDMLCAIPVVMVGVACVLGIVAFRQRSFPVAVMACVLMSSVFVVYHSLKHMGIRLEFI
jgi:hypothetical protein